MVRSVNLRYDDFCQTLQDFADLVIDKCYEKMPYQMWRAVNKSRPANTNVFCEWDRHAIDIAFGDEPEYHHFCFGDNSFGSFLWENVLPVVEEYADDCGVSVKMKIASSEVNKNNVKIDLDKIGMRMKDIDGSWVKVNLTDIKTQCTSAPYYTLKNYKLDLSKFENNEEKKDMKGFNFDFGPVNGNVVRMSMYGMAVRNQVGTFVSYDAKSGEIMDVDVFNFDGANFLYKMPVAMKDIAVGDVVIHHGAPMFVVGKSTDNKGLVVIDVIAGERKEIMLAKSPFGFDFATKVVNFLGDAFNGNSGASTDNPFGNMWMLMAMSGDNKDMSDMLPFMMMANGGKVDSNMMMFMAMSGKGGNDMLPMLMMMNAMNTPAAAPAHECHCGGNCGEHHQ